MPRRAELTGQRFSHLLAQTLTRKHTRTAWRCLCDCGNVVIVDTAHLIGGHTKSCGCWKYAQLCGRKFMDLTGNRYGRLTVLYQVERHGTGAFWRCRCDCGNERTVHGGHLRTGSQVSCGCWRGERASERAIRRITEGKFAASRSGSLFLDEVERLFNVVIEREVVIGRFVFDGRVGNLLIEVDGTFWHTRYGNPENDVHKTEAAKQSGYVLIRCIVEDVRDVRRKIQTYTHLFQEALSKREML